jgi:hypothetical protein
MLLDAGSVMPDLIRHPVPELSEKNTGFRVKPGMTNQQ